MTVTDTETKTKTTRTRETDFDVLLIGAGVSGLYQLYLLRELGLSVRVLEAGSDVGGTWYWNRYPGARLDSEAYSYQFAFAKDLLDEWEWSELFAAQPELERYFQLVAERYDLRKDIEFDTRVSAMSFDEETDNWTVTTEAGDSITSHLVIACTGILSAPIYPRIPGRERFRGESYHTAFWPREKVDFANKKVIVIGTGATGIQVITEIAKTVGHLTVFQRTANWAVPLRNTPMTEESMTEVRAGYAEMFPRLQHTFSGFLHDWDPVPTTAYTDTELQERFHTAWGGPGFSKWFGLPNDVAKDVLANRKWCDFLTERIRERVVDPATAALLTPNDHYFGTKRVPCESGYYEVFNRENVELISLRTNPILEITEKGVLTQDGEIEADTIVYATGFEAFSGALKRIDITGVGDEKLLDAWADGPVTYLGIQVAGFPNLFIMGGPHGKGGHGNAPRCGEKVQEWMARFARHIFDEDISRVAADPDAQTEWSDEVQARGMAGLGAQVKSSAFGDNLDDDDPSKSKKRTFLAYIGALDEYVARLDNLPKSGYPGFIITP